MKLNFKHLQEIDKSYLSHFKFAIGMSIGFIYRALFFLVHGVIPFIQIPEKFNLMASQKWILSEHDKIEKKEK
jgi:hypothetical protein|tara:strand:+ start:924 stop:1142 length:219 start_codon:yes stop_codon:yes gene_type:complete